MIIVESKNPHNRALRLQQLAHNTWYKGVASGKLYYHVVMGESIRRSILIRCEDGVDCTERYSPNGTFTRAEVSVVVTEDDGFKVDWKPNELFEAVTGKSV